MASQVLGRAATLYGVGGALSILLQARQMLTRRASCDVSARFLATYVGGYAIWLLYGLSLGSAPIVLVHAVGLVCGSFTLAVALRLRGSLLSPASWNPCGGRAPRTFSAVLLFDESGRGYPCPPLPRPATKRSNHSRTRR